MCFVLYLHSSLQKMTILPLPPPACCSSFLQGPAFDQRRPNRVGRPPWSRRSSFPLPAPHPPPLPQTATPRWRRRTLLPSVGSRWSPSAAHSNFPPLPPSFRPPSFQQLLSWFSHFGFPRDQLLSLLLFYTISFIFLFCAHVLGSAHARHSLSQTLLVYRRDLGGPLSC